MQGWKPFGDYAGPSVAQFDPWQTAAMGGIADMARSNTGLMPAAISAMNDTLSGKYLDPSTAPGWSDMVDQITRNTLPQVTAQWSAAGRGTGNSEAAGAASDALSHNLGALAYQNYGAERARMLQAAGMAPQLDAARYGDLEKLYGVGQLRQDMS